MASNFSQTYTQPTEDLVVVGGGAGGTALLLQLIERIKDGKSLHRIIVVQKDSVLGPGLAYSAACTGTIINMHTDTMGLFFNKPEHFSLWRKDLESGPFPSRDSYGDYLQALWAQAIEEAEQIGLNVSVVHDDVHDIDRLDDGTFTLTLGRGTRLPARSVVLALGNFTKTAYTHLINLPGFFPCPWPTSQLKSIPTNASVIVIGSRLSAIDAAIFLSENGHQGSITFMSRSGGLPKVQGDRTPFSRRFVLHTLARHVEANSDDGLVKVMSSLMDEIARITHGDWSWLQKSDCPLEQLQVDIQAAQTRKVGWLTVLCNTAPVIERYWNCLPTQSQQLFEEKFYSSWMRYRHATPIQNAQKILDMMKKSQLRVVKGENVQWDGVFKAQTSEGNIEASYVIEATGQECHLAHVQSPLIQSAIQKGLLTSHPVSGVAVDFDTLRASPGLYAIGSLTRGTHFYVSAIDRIAAHAARLADVLTGESLVRPLHIAIFLGSDLFSHLMVSKLVPQLIAAGHTPFIFLPTHKASAKAKPFDLRELAFFEREILQKHVIPFFKDQSREGVTHMTVKQMASTHGILVQDVPSVNSASFINTLKSYYIDVGISLRCYQRFKKDIIRYFSFPRKLCNLHPGVLPAYRGVMTTARAMKNKEADFGYSLHDINEDWDAGDVLDIRTHPIDYSKSMLHYMNDVYDIGVQMLVDVIDRLARGKELPRVLQNADESRYYTFPTKDELEDYRQIGIRLVDADAIVKILVESFSPMNEREKFQAYLERAVQEWYTNEALEARD